MLLHLKAGDLRFTAGYRTGFTEKNAHGNHIRFNRASLDISMHTGNGDVHIYVLTTLGCTKVTELPKSKTAFTSFTSICTDNSGAFLGTA